MPLSPQILKRGVDVLHSDMDAIWIQDPLPLLAYGPPDPLTYTGTVAAYLTKAAVAAGAGAHMGGAGGDRGVREAGAATVWRHPSRRRSGQGDLAAYTSAARGTDDGAGGADVNDEGGSASGIGKSADSDVSSSAGAALAVDAAADASAAADAARAAAAEADIDRYVYPLSARQHLAVREASLVASRGTLKAQWLLCMGWLALRATPQVDRRSHECRILLLFCFVFVLGLFYCSVHTLLFYPIDCFYFSFELVLELVLF